MKTFLLLLLATTAGFAQTDAKTSFDNFKKQLEAYQSNPANSGIKAANCNEYKLVFAVKGSGFQEVVVPKDAGNLCRDLERYDTSKNTAPAGESYDIKAIGNVYYIIRVDRNDGNVTQTWYYYERRN